jgi:ferritin
MKFTLVVTSTFLLFSKSAAFAPRSVTRIPSSFANTAMFSSKAQQVEEVSVDRELLELYNAQVTNELKASQLYLSASIWAAQRELVGMAAYMRNESEEERGHAMQFIDFANKRNFSLELEALPTPPNSWATAQEMWEALLQGEKDNTQALKNLADAAADNREHALSALLDPFHIEQIDSEDSICTILAKVRDQKQTPGLLRQLDSELDPSNVPPTA